MVVQFTEMVVRKPARRSIACWDLSTADHHQLCRTRVALLNINLGHNFLQSALYGFAAAVGFSLVMVLFAAIRERRWPMSRAVSR